MPKGPSLRSAQLTQPTLPQRQQKKIESLLKDLGIPDRPIPTLEVVDLYSKLRKEIYILLNLQKHVIKKENEKKSLEDKIKELKASVSKKTFNNSASIRSPQTPQITGKSMMAKSMTASTKQTIGPMNNFQQYPGPKKPIVKPNKNDSEEFESTPLKRKKKE